MKKFFVNLWVACLDIINAFKFRNEMKSLDIGDDEKFRALKLKTNWLGNVVYTQLDFTEKELIDNDYSIHDLTLNAMKPYIEFFEELGWADYLIPQVSNLQEEDGNMTLSYIYLFVFVPKVFTFWKIIKFLFSIAALTSGIWWLVWYIGTSM